MHESCPGSLWGDGTEEGDVEREPPLGFDINREHDARVIRRMDSNASETRRLMPRETVRGELAASLALLELHKEKKNRQPHTRDKWQNGVTSKPPPPSHVHSPYG